MSTEKIYIVLSHKHRLKPINRKKSDWEVSEKVEFVNQLRKRHTDTAVAIGDFINKKMIKGASNNMNDYTDFISYIEKKYPEQLNELNNVYGDGAGEGSGLEDTKDLAVDTDGNVTVKASA